MSPIVFARFAFELCKFSYGGKDANCKSQVEFDKCSQIYNFN